MIVLPPPGTIVLLLTMNFCSDVFLCVPASLRETNQSAILTDLDSDRGFTLIEVIAVLLLMGILSVMTVVHSNSFGVEADVRGAAEVVKNHLRYAQSKAMNADLGWGINFAGSTYTLQDANQVSATLPGDLPQGMTFSATVNPVLFENRWGSPGSATITVTVSRGGSSQTITVTKNTGFIP